ncbi:hypothetical protein BKA80DRAFT_268541 [Phyllosticta citrichinensis]
MADSEPWIMSPSLLGLWFRRRPEALSLRHVAPARQVLDPLLPPRDGRFLPALAASDGSRYLCSQWRHGSVPRQRHPFFSPSLWNAALVPEPPPASCLQRPEGALFRRFNEHGIQWDRQSGLSPAEPMEPMSGGRVSGAPACSCPSRIASDGPRPPRLHHGCKADPLQATWQQDGERQPRQPYYCC